MKPPPARGLRESGGFLGGREIGRCKKCGAGRNGRRGAEMGMAHSCTWPLTACPLPPCILSSLCSWTLWQHCSPSRSLPWNVKVTPRSVVYRHEQKANGRNCYALPCSSTRVLPRPIGCSPAGCTARLLCNSRSNTQRLFSSAFCFPLGPGDPHRAEICCLRALGTKPRSSGSPELTASLPSGT